MYRVDIPNSDYHWYKTVRNHFIKQRLKNINVGFDKEKQTAYIVTTNEYHHMYIMFAQEAMLTQVFDYDFKETFDSG
jgi:hypothetical protein